jgi:hypothetical protein
MRALWILGLTLLPSMAMAQVPAGLDMPGVAVPQGQIRFVVADTTTQRFFAGSEAAGPALSAGEAVTLVTEAKGRVRILVRGAFGWVPAAALSEAPPPIELTPPGELPSLLPPG